MDDADAAAQRVLDAGGQVLHPPFDSPYGRIAGCADPHGATFDIIDMSRRGSES